MPEENVHLHNYVYSSDMVEFVTAANDFCHFLEQLKGVDGKNFIERSVHLLSGVYHSILKTGVTEPIYESSGEPTVSEQDWSTIYQRIAMVLGAHNEYLRPASEDEFDRSDLVTHTISEDMADVYQELRDFTTVYSRGMEELMNDAAWEVKERFAEHWGKKLIIALNALHTLYTKGIDPTGED
ncbi:MAG: DUF5063 domain-containing protein [Bacteroidales bacterium]|nr:DUF5063 domain-containing protein [Bacteroidales bacterium]